MKKLYVLLFTGIVSFNLLATDTDHTELNKVVDIATTIVQTAVEEIKEETLIRKPTLEKTIETETQEVTETQETMETIKTN